ncbi:MAG: M23 family metallopeptidase, partial [Candidatus Promineifilaceae bacterium]
MSEFRFEVWPTEYRVLTQQFAANPTYYGQFGLPGHEGVDIRAPRQSKIFCVASGRVIKVNHDPTESNYGLYVKVLHENGYRTTYAHLSTISVSESEVVSAGHVLGLAGDSGNARGAHLHLGLQQTKDNVSGWPHDIIDPTPYLLPLLGWKAPSGATLEGWILSGSLYKDRDLAQLHVDGARFWTGRNKNYWLAGGTVVALPGAERSGYTLVRVTYAALGVSAEKLPIKPNTIPQPTVATVDGWAWASYLNLSDEDEDEGYAVTDWRGINLRRQPFRRSGNIGFIRPNSTLLLLPGKEGGYQRVRVLRSDFEGAVTLPVLPPLPHMVGLLPDHPKTDDTVFLGWVRTESIELRGAYGRINHPYGAGLYPKPVNRGVRYAIVKGFATVARAGANSGIFTPVLVNREEMLSLAKTLPTVKMPNPLSKQLDPVWPKPPHDSTPAWVLTAEIEGEKKRIGRFGTLLVVRPQRDADVLAQSLPFSPVVILGEPYGEFTPVRIPDTHLTWLHPVLTPPDGVLDNNWDADEGEWTTPSVVPEGPWVPAANTPPQAPVAPAVPPRAPSPPPAPPKPPVSQPAPPKPPVSQPAPPKPPVSQPAPSKPPVSQPAPPKPPAPQPAPPRPHLPVMGTARIGLHASADPHITSAEIAEFALLKPGLIKVSSFHDPSAIKQLAKQHPNASWLLRAFLEFGGRNVSPVQFVEWTLGDVQRSLRQLGGKKVIVELHNEPNLYAEGLGKSWQDGATFAKWWLDVLRQYRQALPAVKFMYPGLSPGHDVANVRRDHIAFLEASRSAVNAADALGVHIYWGDNYPMGRALGVLDDYLARVPHKSVWITEASNNSPSVPHQQKGAQYIKFWQALQKRSGVGGVTYFVASSSNPKFAP